MADARSQRIFSDIFEVEAVNPKGKKFDRVNRLVCKGETWDVQCTVDIASEIYSVKKGEKLAIALVSTLRLDGEPDDGTYQHNEGEESLLDQYDYGMHGRVFKYEYEEDDKVSVYISFGGLLMLLVGDQGSLSSLKLDQKLYCLMRKSAAGGDGPAAGGSGGR